MNKYTIHIKGNIPATIRDSVYFNREYSDLTYEYGFINYKGTDEQLDGLLEYLTLKGEAEFKIIGVYEDNAEEEEYYKNLLTNFKVIDPLPYDSMVDLISKCRFIISDSGGIQEEASFLKKKVIVCRKFTERIETINKTSFMCDSPEDLKGLFKKVKKEYISNYVCPYGDGNAANKIYKILKNKIK